MLNALKRLLPSRPGTASQSEATPANPGEWLINAYATHRELIDATFPHERHAQRDRTDPELGKHLQGFMGYISSRGDGKMTHTRYHTLRHVQCVQQHVSMTVGEAALESLTAWALANNALLFLPDGSVRDPELRILVAADGATDADAIVPFPASAQARKARQQTLLAERNLHPPTHLPVVIAETEVVLRTAKEAAERCLALLAVAVHGESLNIGKPLDLDEFLQDQPLVQAALSPGEQAFLDDDAPSTEDGVRFSWRYESLHLLAWALGLIDTLTFPDRMCDVPNLIQAFMSRKPEQILSNAALRPAGELLDALDLHYRLHWLVRQASLDQRPAPGELNASVIWERHYALNWLVRFENADWDDVDTPT